MSLKRSLGAWGFALVAGLSLTACGPDYPNCETDQHCQKSETGKAEGRLYCVNQLCQQCKVSTDCGDAAMECRAGVCERIPGYCVGTSDCPGNQVCRDNRCGAECLAESDCGDGKTCKGGTCVAKAECSSDTDCSDGQKCDNGRCKAPYVAGPCGMDTVYFDYNSSTLDDSAKGTLNQVASCIKERNVRVQIAGHADERGTSEYNIALGERRASSVRKFLVQMGIGDKTLSTISYGEERIVSTCGEEGEESCHRSNRRTEFSDR